MLSRRRPRASHGFTLVELMVVVMITGILAAIGIMLVRQHLQSAKTVNALAGIQAIRSAEETYRANGGAYLDCSTVDGPAWFPSQNPGTKLYDWRQPTHPDWARWQLLAISATKEKKDETNTVGSSNAVLRPTQFGFAVNAGVPGAAYPTLRTQEKPVLPNPSTEPWYVIQVKGDVDGDGTPMFGIATNLNGQVFLENEGN
jgi:prepilin-type N-terminal cleavage/methylation domain-containing protein